MDQQLHARGVDDLIDQLRSAFENNPIHDAFTGLFNNDDEEEATTTSKEETKTTSSKKPVTTTREEEDPIFTPPPRQDRPPEDGLTWSSARSTSSSKTSIAPSQPTATSQRAGWVPVPQSSTTQAPSPTPTSSATRIEAPESSLNESDVPTLVLTDRPSSFTTSTRSRTTSSQTFSSTADSDSAQSQNESSGMSTGGKAGLAIGIILIIALIAGLGVFFYRRKKKNQDHSQLDDEKADMARSLAGPRSNATAPRLSLRPLTQLFPGMGGSSEKTEASNMIANSAAAAVVPRARTPDMRQVNPNANPFGDEAADKTLLAVPAAAVAPTNATKANSERSLSNLSDRTHGADGAFPPSVAGSRRNSPPGPGPNNVHRVQLDFKPSMEDELELRAGSLVRLLHEYDDGWALCIRLDRTQQGVVPRTCISKAPVKPRPGPPPPGMRSPPQGGRPRAPPGPGPRQGPYPNPHHGPGNYNGRPMGPPPAGRFRSQSNSPRQPRPESPAFQGAQAQRPRSNSDMMAPRQSPPNNSLSPLAQDNMVAPPQSAAMPVRKPVPGMAM